jgi:hypothetical protein
MTHEEKMVCRDAIHHEGRMLMERLKKVVSEPIGLAEMMDVADILKDLSYVEKNIAKAHYYESERPRYEDKKY